MNLFEELKRRNVFKAALVYIIAGWVVMQVVDVMFPALHLPEWTVTLVAALMIIGFPFVLILSWVYELTPEGLKLERDVEAADSITPQTSRKLNYLIVGLLAVAIGLLLFNRFMPTRGTVEPPAPSDDVVTGVTGSDGLTSVAVLPFVNMSDDPGNEYFSDGLSEELINVLVRIKGLRVPSRTSSFAFKDENIAISEIAQQLKVNHILEGSVRKAGDTVRITAQLIDVGTDTHLWSETYDRQLEDIFAIQEEIAGNIVEALQETLGADQEVSVAPLTDDMEAYQLYLRGRHLFSQRSVGPAIDLLSRAVELDPEFAEAWSSLASVHVASPPYDPSIDPQQARVEAKSAADRAIALKQDLARPYAVLAVLATHDLDWLQAEQELKTALSLNPSDPTVRFWYGAWLSELGYFEEGQAHLLQALEQDPVSGVMHRWVAWSYIFMGDFDSGAAYAQRARELGDAHSRFVLSDLAELQGDFEEAIRLFQEFGDIIGRETPCIEQIWPVRQHGVANDEAVACIKERAETWAGLYMMAGAMDEANQRYPDLVRRNPSFLVDLWGTHAAAIQGHPGFTGLLAELGVIAIWDERGWPEHCRREGDRVQCIVPQPR